MRHHNPKLLYFSLDEKRVSSFFYYLETNQSWIYNRILFTIEARRKTFNNGAELLLFLDNYKDDMKSLCIIIDIESIPVKIEQPVHIEQIENIRKAILSYPEVHFLFDSRVINEKYKHDILSLLFPDENNVFNKWNGNDKETVQNEWKNVKKDILTDFISIDWENSEKDADVLLYYNICGKDNTFDASNLRYALKYWKYICLKVYNHRNLAKLQDSRRNHLAISVEEESKQNTFNSYALYINGFRVLPITSALELNEINDLTKEERKENVKELGDKLNPEKIIIVRDFDLQFEDEGKKVNQYRGYKYSEEEFDGYQRGWNDIRTQDPPKKGDNNIYWNNMSNCPEYYITKGPRHSKIKRARKNKKTEIKMKRRILCLRGILKPVSGLYTSIQSIYDVKERYKSTLYTVRDSGYEIETARENHDHSTPLDIYELASNMLSRAEDYYSNGRFMLASLVSGEVIEILNGFHLRLMTKAIYINAKAENAIAMDIVGGDENALAEDADFRIKKIRGDIKRLYFRKNENDRSSNVLNQIFSDCRLSCKDKEHFNAEDRFLSAMGHINEGDRLPHLIHYFCNLITFDLIKFYNNKFKKGNKNDS